jgi:hypothetical protein
MANTLSDGATTIALPDDMLWSDRDVDWKVGQNIAYSLGGALIMENVEKLSGRPITLQSGGTSSPTFAIVTRATLDALKAYANVARAQDDPLTLTIDYAGSEEAYDVQFLYPEAVKGESLQHVVPYEDADLYSITLKFITV